MPRYYIIVEAPTSRDAIQAIDQIVEDVRTGRPGPFTQSAFGWRYVMAIEEMKPVERERFVDAPELTEED